MPEACKDAVLVLMITDWAAEMAADITDGFDLAFIFVQQNVVVIDPTGNLAAFLQLVKRNQVLIGGLSAFFLDDNDIRLSRT